MSTFRPVKVFKGVGEFQAGQEEHRFQKLLKLLQSFHAPRRRTAAAEVYHLINVLSKTFANLQRKPSSLPQPVSNLTK